MITLGDSPMGQSLFSRLVDTGEFNVLDLTRELCAINLIASPPSRMSFGGLQSRAVATGVDVGVYVNRDS
jgi:hypothetical protein